MCFYCRQYIHIYTYTYIYNPCNPPLKQWVAELQRDVINPNDRMRRVLPEPPLIAERNCKSLKNHLMPTRLPAPLDAVTGNFKCDRSKCFDMSAAFGGNRKFQK